MYKVPIKTNTRLKKNTSTEGETIEETITRMINNGDANFIEKEIIYTPPEKGVLYGTDIRGDKFDKAIENTEKVTNDVRKKRAKKWEERQEILAKHKTKSKPDDSVDGVLNTTD